MLLNKEITIEIEVDKDSDQIIEVTMAVRQHGAATVRVSHPTSDIGAVVDDLPARTLPYFRRIVEALAEALDDVSCDGLATMPDPTICSPVTLTGASTDGHDLRARVTADGQPIIRL